MATGPLDCVTIGETMLRFDVDPATPLEDVRDLRVFVAGAESNVAVTLSRLGRRAAWISRLPDDPLGRRVDRDLRAHGVDTSRVTWEKDGRLGCYYTQLAVPPRTATVLYDRRGSSFSRLAPEGVDWEFVHGARVLHLTGITPALGEGPAAVVGRALREAKGSGQWVSFDLNYRGKLWSAERARDTLLPLLPTCDLLICSRRDAQTVFGLTGSPEDVGRELWHRAGSRCLVLTLGGEGAGVFDGSRWVTVPAVAAPTVDPIGRGDAFAAGVIYGVLTEDSVDAGVRFGVRLAALKQTFRGDVAWVTPQDLRDRDGGIDR
jgi:2-dehydro-3-deoxygluconokinase